MRADASACPRRGFAAAALMVSMLALTACQSRTTQQLTNDPLKTASSGPASVAETVKLSDQWQKDPGNVKLGLAYVAGLERIGQSDRQLEVLSQLASAHPEDGTVQALYGKKLLTAGNAQRAITPLERAAALPGANWQVFNALGSAYDDMGEYAKAQTTYQRALSMSPSQIQVMNNMGMSQALSGNLKTAEATLRQALALPSSQSYPKIRQNLALVVGLQGRFDESRTIASADLPPDQVEANLAYLEKMMAQPNTWQQLAGSKNSGG